MSDDNGINMALCSICGALPHQPCTERRQPAHDPFGFLSHPEKWPVASRIVAHLSRQRIGGPRGGRRRR